MADDDTLCGWGDAGKVAYFLANADIIVPRRDEQLKLLVQLLPYPLDAAFSILDLGAGFGAITEQMLEHYSRATVTCVDGSEAMVAQAQERLRQYNDRVKILRADLAYPSWTAQVTGGFDAPVSAIAIHHLTNDRKRELSLEVFQLLGRRGMFLNNS